MTTTEKVPIPADRLWRECKIRLLPGVVFLAVCAVVAVLWRQHVIPGHLSGVAHVETYQLRAPRDGYVVDLTKQRFDQAEQGEPLLTITAADVPRLRAQLDVLHAEIELIHAGLEPVIGRQRNRINYESLWIDLVRTRIQLASDQLRKQQTRREAERREVLYRKGLIAEADYDTIVTELDILNTTIHRNEELVEELAARLTAIEAVESAVPMDATLAAAVAVKELELAVVETELRPLTLYSPSSGLLSEVTRKNGEFVARGETILSLHPGALHFVIAYLRQPLTRIPEPGTRVHVISKARRAMYDGTITRIGSQLEPLHEALLRPGQLPERALPIRIELEPGHALLPGEVVDIRLL